MSEDFSKTAFAIRAKIDGRMRKMKRNVIGFDAVKTYAETITGTGMNALLVATDFEKVRSRLGKDAPIIDVWMMESLLSTVPFQIVAIREVDYASSKAEVNH